MPVDKLRELPLPMLARQLRQRLPFMEQTDYFRSCVWFDKAAARRLEREEASAFIGVETCALSSLRAARQRGMKAILDCPGIPAPFLARQIQLAADDLGIKPPDQSTSARMDDRRQAEMAEADLVLVCSEMQSRFYISEGMAATKLRMNPLWVDEIFTSGAEAPRKPRPAGSKLRVLFVGHATVGKGAPYALKAIDMLGDTAELTFVGGVDETTRKLAGGRMQKHRIIEWMPRSELLNVYPKHDVLLFPTLGDSFGFVGMEAMACGLPVVTTTNAGMPVPDPAWRVAPRDAGALAARLQAYASDEAKLEVDSRLARDFVRDFTPANFRKRAQAIFREVLS
jgi:glycosyltransferase involved in cell wall biosynthesis